MKITEDFFGLLRHVLDEAYCLGVEFAMNIFIEVVKAGCGAKDLSDQLLAHSLLFRFKLEGCLYLSDYQYNGQKYSNEPPFL